MFEKFDIDDNNIFKVCVVATMSSGKSTFINSIIGEEIMPEKNEACTARTMSVLDNDSAITKKAHIIRKNGTKEIVEITNREVLERINNDEDVEEFLIETDIQSIPNTDRAMVLVDTPGVNNSGDERHGRRTEEFLEQMDMGVIIYLLNATQLATNDDSILLQFVSKHLKKQAGRVKIIFVINKIDALDLETESITGIVKDAKEYIESHEIENPIIYPLSALAAKTLRMALHRQKMTRRQQRKLEDIYESYRSRDNNMLMYAMLDNLSEEVYQIGENEISAQELRRAIDNTGITAIEKRLEGFMREIEKHYNPEIIIKSQLSKSVAQTFEERLQEISSFPDLDNWTIFKSSAEKISQSKTLQKMNFKMGTIEEIHYKIDCTVNEILINIGDLIENIESVKLELFKTFGEGKYEAVNGSAGFFWSPEKDEKKKITARNLYLMSEDKKNWVPVQFGKFSDLIGKQGKLYLASKQQAFIFKVTETNLSDVIAILDIKIPIRIIRITEEIKEDISVDEIENYIVELEEKAQTQQKEILDAEDKLKRTYKGILFQSEREKELIIHKEERIQKYCLRLDEKDFNELWIKKEELSSLPAAIFSPYLAKIVEKCAICENRDKNLFLEFIKQEDLSNLDKILKKIAVQHYSDEVKRVMKDATLKRKLECQRTALESVVVGIETLSREELKKKIEEIESRNYDKALTAEYVSFIEKQYDIVEERELRMLCADIMQKNLPELDELEIQIRRCQYQEKFAEQYYNMIGARIEFLHIQNLEKYCENVIQANKEELKKIREKVEEESCSSKLKTKYYELIEKQKSKLDYNDFYTWTSNLKEQSLEEVESLYKKLQTDEYEIGIICKFEPQIRVAIEQKQKENAESLVKNLAFLNREQVLEVETKVNQLLYPERITCGVKDKIQEKKYLLDILELIELENDFDRLSLNDIQNLRRLIAQKNICKKSRDIYLQQLGKREMIIAYQFVSRSASYIRQMLVQYGLTELNIKLALFSSDYTKYLRKHYQNGGIQDFSNIPVLFFPDCAFLTITRTELYYKAGSEYKRISLMDVRSCAVEKRLFSQVIVITFSDGNRLIISEGIDKKNARVVADFLNCVIYNVNREEVLSNYQPYMEHLESFREEDFQLGSTTGNMRYEHIENIFNKKFQMLQEKEKFSSIKYEQMDGWSLIEPKIIQKFGILNESKIIWYYGKGYFNTAKEGVVIGREHFYIKEGEQNLNAIAYNDIVCLKYKEKQIILLTRSNHKYIVRFDEYKQDIAGEIVELINEYIEGIQLLNSTIGDAVVNQIQSKRVQLGVEESRCPNCNTVVSKDARFCPQCGSKIICEKEQPEYFFCTNCGQKLKTGTRFCINCGQPVES